MSEHKNDDEGGQGPFRDNASPADPTLPLSIPATAALPCALGGWISLYIYAEGVEAMRLVGLALLLLSGVLGLLGLIDTKPTLADGAEELAPPKRGRPLAKLALGVLLGPIVLGCVGLGLLLLTCMGH